MRFVAAALVLAALVTTTTAADAGPAKKKKKQAAVVLVIDRSGSMQGPKLAAALDAAAAASASLRKNDLIGVVTFDSAATISVPLQKAGDGVALATGLATIKAGGGTNMITGVREAYGVLGASKAKIKHVIVLSDGETPYDHLQELVAAMHVDGITLSTVAVAGADMKLMNILASTGGGRIYDVQDLATLSQVFADETKAAVH
jgi:Ca-activated chloride channel family protein